MDSQGYTALGLIYDTIVNPGSSLPPYSPDLNPIEMAFSKLKALIRKAAARIYEELWNAVAQVCNLFTDEECLNFFIAAGYGTD